LKVIEHLQRESATARDVCKAHGLSLNIALKLLNRLVYANQVMVVDKIEREGCKRKVAVYQAKRAA
jgi:hypothetical protein